MEAIVKVKDDEGRKRPPSTVDMDNENHAKRRKALGSTLSSHSSALLMHQQQRQHADLPRVQDPSPIAAADDHDGHDDDNAPPVVRIPMDRLPAPPPLINRISISPARLTQSPSSTKTMSTAMTAPAAASSVPTDVLREISSVTQDTEPSTKAEASTLVRRWPKVDWTRIMKVFVPILCIVATTVGWTPPFRSNIGNNNPDSHWEPPIWSNESPLTKTHRSSSSNGILMGLESDPPLTLRQVLESPFHLAMAPAFFGFYGYFGVLAAWQQALLQSSRSLHDNLQSVAGASAGAMAAVLLGAGIDPQVAANFCANLTLSHFADFPGFLAVFRGNRFEALMENFLLESSIASAKTTRLEDGILPVAVTAFDLQTLQLQILTRGSMARAARASATFPLLFQPVGWNDPFEGTDYLFLDGGIVDHAGLLGLTHTLMAKQSSNSTVSHNRVINLSIGGFLTNPPPGPETLPGNTEVISISIQHLPQPGPWAMANGKRAFDNAKIAMGQSLDVPLQEVVRRSSVERTIQTKHYELHIDATSFQKQKS